jgi:hypothetical protein
MAQLLQQAGHNLVGAWGNVADGRLVRAVSIATLANSSDSI